MTFGERLVYARELRGYNQKTFASLLEVTPTRLNYWEKDKREPDVLMIWNIISILKISGNWLIGGDGEIEPTKKAPAGNIGESDLEKERLIQNYDNMNQVGREKLVDYSDYLADDPKHAKNPAAILTKKQA